jgi:hypothetical protein
MQFVTHREKFVDLVLTVFRCKVETKYLQLQCGSLYFIT